MLTLWALIPFTAFVCNLMLAVYAVHAGLRNPVNRMFAFFVGVLAWWALCVTAEHMVRDAASTTIASSLGAPVWILIGPLMVHFTLVVLRGTPLLRDYPAFALAYVLGLPLLWFQWTRGAIFYPAERVHPWGMEQGQGPLILWYSVYVAAFGLLALVLVALGIHRAADRTERMRLLCVAVGLAVPLVGGVTSELIVPIYGFVPYASALALTGLGAVVFALGIFRYRMLRPTLLRSANEVLRTMTQPVLLLDVGGEIVDANPATHALMLASGEDLIGRPIASVFAGGDGEWRRVLAQQAGDGHVTNYETTWTTAQGETVPMLLSVIALHDAEGACEGYLLLGVDYGELKQAQEAVQESEELYRTLYEDSVQGVALIWDTIHEVNAQAAEILGCTREELVGRRPEEFWPDMQPDGRPSIEAVAEIRGAALAGDPQFFPWRLLRPDGRLVDCEMSMHAVTVRGKRILQLAMRDVTEQRRLEEAIQYLHHATAGVVGEGFFVALAQHLSQWLGMNWVVIGELRPDDPGVLHSRAVWHQDGPADPIHKALSGAPCEEVVNLGFYRVESGAAAAYPDDEGLQQMGIESYVGLSLKDERGRAIGLLCAFHEEPLPVPPHVVEALFKLCAARVSAELLRLRADEYEREHAEHLRELQRTESIALLAGGVAHDFNNILVGVLGHASLARESLPADDPAQHSLSVIESSAERAVGLTTQLLAYARGGQQNPEPVNLRTVVVDLLDMMEAVLPKSVKVQGMLPEDTPIVLADESQMQQVVMNLCTNAGEAMGESGGLLTVQLHQEAGPPHCADPTHGPANLHVVLTISDTGCGMDAATQARIFEPFYSTKEFGRGLGLSAVMGIVLNHGGCLHCTSTPRTGTTFTVRLPAHGAECAATPATPAAPACPLAENGRETILLVEDEEMVSEFVEHVLGRLGYHVLNAASGEQALEIFRDRRDEIDLVLMDMIMPGKNGLQTLEDMRVMDPDVRAILTSGYGADQLPGQPNGFPVPCFLKKPYRSRVLADAVRQALAN